MTPTSESVRVDLPLPVSLNARAAVSLCKEQSTLIKQCPAYPTSPGVQSAVSDLDAAVAVLEGTCSRIDQLRAELSALEGTRGTQLATVHLKHDAVEAACNNASDNDPQVAKAWTGKTKERTKRAQVPVSEGPPENPTVNVIKRRPGSVKASCTEEAGAVSYLFQTGTDPNHPESWPAPTIIAPGHTHTFRNLPIGQLFCVRIAVVRRGSVQGAWSTVLQITVR